MIAVKAWFKSLPKRDQYALMIGAAFVMFYLVYGVLITGMLKQKDRYEGLLESSRETYSSMLETVSEIRSLQKSSGVSSRALDKPITQLVQQSAQRTKVAINRFQPSGDEEVQVWFDKVEFNKLAECLSILELDYAVRVLDASITSANTPGLVNAKIKFSR